MDVINTGLLIAQARKEKELTQGELAQALHVTTQAVSKWERGLNFPDIALLEPLAEQLGLTVSELLSGQRGALPQEEQVRDSLRVGLAQLGGRLKKWRGLFWVALALLLVISMSWGYLYLRDETELLPQGKTVVAPREGTPQEFQAAQAAGGPMPLLYTFDVALSDNFRGCTLQMELWTKEGLTKSWELANCGFTDLPRHQTMAFSVQYTQQNLQAGALPYGLSFLDDDWYGTLEDIPYLNDGLGWQILPNRAPVSQEDGAVLVCFILNAGLGAFRLPHWTQPGQIALPPDEGVAFLLLRMYCE